MNFGRSSLGSEGKRDLLGSWDRREYHDEADGGIACTTIDLGRNHGLQVVAEGVQDQATVDALVALGCDYAQGFFLSRPLPPPHFGEWLREATRERGKLVEGKIERVTPVDTRC